MGVKNVLGLKVDKEWRRVSPALEPLCGVPLYLPPRKASKPRENGPSEEPSASLTKERKDERIAWGTKYQEF